MDMLSMFMYTSGGLLLVLLLLFVIPKIKVFLKKNKEKKKEMNVIKVKKEEHKKKVEKNIPPFAREIVLFKEMIASFILFVLLGFFLIFETEVVNFVRGYAIELAPINYVSLFTLLGLIFLTRGAILALKSKKIKNNSIRAFVWIMQGFALFMVALFYDLLNYVHFELFGRFFSALLILLVIWEVIVLIGIFRGYKKVC